MKKIITLTLVLLSFVIANGQGFKTFKVEGQIYPALIKDNSKGTSVVEVIVDENVNLEKVDFKYNLYSRSVVKDDIKPDFTEPQVVTINRKDVGDKVWEIKIMPLIPVQLPLKLNFTSNNTSKWNSSVKGWAGLGIDDSKNTVVRFGNQDVAFIVAFNEDAQSVSYELTPLWKVPTNFDGLFKVETSNNGKDWKTIYTFDKNNNFDSSGKYSHPIETGTRYIKWMYNERNKLNINLNNIFITSDTQ